MNTTKPLTLTEALKAFPNPEACMAARPVIFRRGMATVENYLKSLGYTQGCSVMTTGDGFGTAFHKDGHTIMLNYASAPYLLMSAKYGVTDLERLYI